MALNDSFNKNVPYSFNCKEAKTHGEGGDIVEHPLAGDILDFLNPALALLGKGLKESPIGQKLDFANHPYLCKGLNIFYTFAIYSHRLFLFMQRSLILLFSNDIFVQTNATAATMALNDSFNKNVPYSFN
jgi:hypothetical protein